MSDHFVKDPFVKGEEDDHTGIYVAADMDFGYFVLEQKRDGSYRQHGEASTFDAAVRTAKALTLLHRIETEPGTMAADRPHIYEKASEGNSSRCIVCNEGPSDRRHIGGEPENLLTTIMPHTFRPAGQAWGAYHCAICGRASEDELHPEPHKFNGIPTANCTTCGAILSHPIHSPNKWMKPVHMYEEDRHARPRVCRVCGEPKNTVNHRP